MTKHADFLRTRKILQKLGVVLRDYGVLMMRTVLQLLRKQLGTLKALYSSLNEKEEVVPPVHALFRSCSIKLGEGER